MLTVDRTQEIAAISKVLYMLFTHPSIPTSSFCELVLLCNNVTWLCLCHLNIKNKKIKKSVWGTTWNDHFSSEDSLIKNVTFWVPMVTYPVRMFAFIVLLFMFLSYIPDYVCHYHAPDCVHVYMMWGEAEGFIRHPLSSCCSICKVWSVIIPSHYCDLKSWARGARWNPSDNTVTREAEEKTNT